MKRVGRCVALVLGLALAACSSPTEPDWSAVSEATNAARQRWQGAALPRYTLVQQRVCECLVEMSGPVRMVVRRSGGEEDIESLTYTSSGEPVAAPYRGHFLTVDAVFDWVLALAGTAVRDLQVEFHPTLGYPERVFVDFQEPLADDEIEYRLSDLEAY